MKRDSIKKGGPTTTGELIRLLLDFNQDTPITNEQGEPFIHIVSRTDGSTILSTNKPLGNCGKCGSYVYPTTTEGYRAYCPDDDEDLYTSEIILK